MNGLNPRMDDGHDGLSLSLNLSWKKLHPFPSNDESLFCLPLPIFGVRPGHPDISYFAGASWVYVEMS